MLKVIISHKLERFQTQSHSITDEFDFLNFDTSAGGKKNKKKKGYL